MTSVRFLLCRGRSSADVQSSADRFFPPEHFQRVHLTLKWYHLRIFLLCPAILGPGEEAVKSGDREYAVEAREAARAALQLALQPGFRDSLKAARHTQLAHAAWSAILSLKMSALLPESVEVQTLVANVADMADLLAECPESERFAITIRIALERFRNRTLTQSAFRSSVNGVAEGPSNAATPASTTSEPTGTGTGDAAAVNGLGVAAGTCLRDVRQTRR